MLLSFSPSKTMKHHMQPSSKLFRVTSDSPDVTSSLPLLALSCCGPAIHTHPGHRMCSFKTRGALVVPRTKQNPSRSCFLVVLLENVLNEPRFFKRQPIRSRSNLRGSLKEPGSGGRITEPNLSSPLVAVERSRTSTRVPLSRDVSSRGDGNQIGRDGFPDVLIS